MENSIGRDLYEKFNLNRPLFIPPHTSVTTGADAGPSSQYSDHPVGPTLNIATTSGQIMSDTGLVLPSHLQSTMMVTPMMPLQATTSFTPQNHVGTPSHHRMQNPVIPQIPTGGGKSSISGKIPTGGKPSFSGQIPTGGKPSFGGQVPIISQTIAGGKVPSYFVRNPQPSWGPPQGGYFNPPHQGGSSNPNPQGGSLNPNPSRLYSGQPFPGVLNPTWGPQGQSYFPPQGQIGYPPQGQLDTLLRVKLVTLLRVKLVTLLRVKLVILPKVNLVTLLKVKLVILPWVTLVILLRVKWVFLHLLPKFLNK
jgi:hypothetical protein